jgi:hypothetical protein
MQADERSKERVGSAMAAQIDTSSLFGVNDSFRTGHGTVG